MENHIKRGNDDLLIRVYSDRCSGGRGGPKYANMDLTKNSKMILFVRALKHKCVKMTKRPMLMRYQHLQRMLMEKIGKNLLFFSQILIKVEYY